MTELSKEKRITKELNRIKKLFEDIPGNQKTIITGLLENAAFMKITLEDLQETIVSEGVVDKYQNGNNQFGVKPSATLQGYNSLVKNYAAVVKQLAGLLPPEQRPSVIAKLQKQAEGPSDREKELERKLEEEIQKYRDADFRRAVEMQRADRAEFELKQLKESR